MLKVLILTQYYPPETGAPQNRLSSLAKHLHQEGMEISILTAFPNYPKMEIFPEFKNKWYTHEKDLNGISIYRSWIFVRKSKSIVSRLLNYFSFVLTSLICGIFKIGKKDIVICESPPLFLGITALLLKWLKGSKLVFNVSDLWPESAEKLGIINNKFILKLTEKLELYIYKKSDLISGQTQGIVKSISERTQKKKTFWLRNGIDLSQFSESAVTYNWRNKNGFINDDFIVMYGGVLGHAQGLNVIIDTAILLKSRKNLKFIIVGDGPEKDNIQQLIAEHSLTNVSLYPNQPSNEMPNIINSCNAAVIPLKKLDLFKGAIPSKIFEYLIYRKPILLGVDGEARELFIDKGKCGIYFTPESAVEMSTAIKRLMDEKGLAISLGENGEKYVRAEFNRKDIALDFMKSLNSLFNK